MESSIRVFFRGSTAISRCFTCNFPGSNVCGDGTRQRAVRCSGAELDQCNASTRQHVDTGLPKEDARAPPGPKIVRHSNDYPKKNGWFPRCSFFVWLGIVGSLSLFGVILKLRSRSSCSDPEFRKWWILEPGKLGFPIWWESKGLHAQPKYSMYQGSCGFVEDWTTKWDRCSNSKPPKWQRNRLPILEVGNVDGN